MALDYGVVGLADGYDASAPIRVSRYTINDDHPKNRWLSVPEIFMYSSNIGAAKMARGYAKRLGGTFAIIDKRRPAPNMSQVLNVVGDVDGKNCILTDDLVDTGTTAKAVRDRLPKAHFATIYAKPAGRPLVDTFITEVSQDTWILFPWDIGPSYREPISRGG